MTRSAAAFYLATRATLIVCGVGAVLLALGLTP